MSNDCLMDMGFLWGYGKGGSDETALEFSGDVHNILNILNVISGKFYVSYFNYNFATLSNLLLILIIYLLISCINRKVLFRNNISISY